MGLTDKKCTHFNTGACDMHCDGCVDKAYAEEAPDLSYLEGASAAADVIADVKLKIKKMRQLEVDMFEKQLVYDQARKEYDDYKATVVLASMTSAGLNSLEDDEGNFIKLETRFHCNPNKNDADRKIINEWLASQGGGFLVKRQGIVEAEQLDMMRNAGIPFAEKTDMNTNSLKAFLKDLLGYSKGGVSKIALEDIPDQMHFIITSEVVSG